MQYLKTKDPWNARSSWKRSMGPSELYPATGTRGRMVSAEKGWGSAWNRTLDLTPDLSISLTFQSSIQNPHYQNLKASPSLGQTWVSHLIRVGRPLSYDRPPCGLFGAADSKTYLPTPRGMGNRSNTTPCVEASICHEDEVLLLNDGRPHAAYSIRYSPADAPVKVPKIEIGWWTGPGGANTQTTHARAPSKRPRNQKQTSSIPFPRWRLTGEYFGQTCIRL